MNTESLDETMKGLVTTALRVKDERDEAVRLLKEGLLYSHIGQHGSFKCRVREFLIRLRVYPQPDERTASRPDHDMNTRCEPLESNR